MRTIQKAISIAMMLSGANAGTHCMPGGGGCPRTASGEHMHCGYYSMVSSRTMDNMSTSDFLRNAQSMCVRDSDCNQPIIGNSRGQGIQYYCPEAECPPFTRMNRDLRRCTAVSCRSDQIQMMNGSCQTCNPPFYPDQNRRVCLQSRVRVMCGPREQISPDGQTCYPCPNYTKGQLNNSICEADRCSSGQVVTIEGTCSLCPPYTSVQLNQRTCSQPVCTGRDIIDISGQCRQCSPYTVPMPDRRNCGQENCPQNSKLNREGKCEACPSGTSVSGDMRFCTINVQSNLNSQSSDRIKQVQFMSISPLDRLLNQRDRNDNIMVRASCQGGQRGKSDKDYKFDLSRERINRLTCFDGSTPSPGGKCQIDNDEMIECGAGQPYVIELFDLRSQEIQNLPLPPSLGSFTVTKEMMECMVDDKLQIHFEFGKRQELAGAVACFDHVPYIRPSLRASKQQTVEDEIPFTMLNICHKNSVSRRRCFLYAYQITIFVRDSDRNEVYPLIEPKVYAKINFNSLSQKMIVLPGDQTKVRFATSYSDQESVRMMPEIHSPQLPEPFRSRYHVSNGAGSFDVRLPCDTMKVADTIQCERFVAHCADPNDKISFSIVGSGDMFLIEQRCSEFFQGFIDWERIEYLLKEDVEKFTDTFSESDGRLKTFKINKVTFINKWGVEQTEEGWFDFEYQISWRWHSQEPKCFAGDHLTKPQPKCSYKCAEKQCLLKSPGGVNKDVRRMLQENQSISAGRQLQLAGNDISAADYVDSTLPIDIPTRQISTGGYKVPDRLMNMYLSNYDRDNRPGRTNLIETSVYEEGTEMIALSTVFEGNIGPQYTYNAIDKTKIDNSPPVAVQITKVPEKGQMVTSSQGKKQKVHVGDLVNFNLVESISYDQGVEKCSSINQDECLDTFSFIPLSSWIGKGPESQTYITLKPLEGRDPHQLLADNDECNAEYPQGLITCMAIFIVTLVGSGAGAMYYLFFSKSKDNMAIDEQTPIKDQLPDIDNQKPEIELSDLNLKAQHQSQQSQIPLVIQQESNLSDYKTQSPNIHQNSGEIQVESSIAESQQNISLSQSPDKLLMPVAFDNDDDSTSQNQEHCNDYSIQIRLSKFNDQKSEASPQRVENEGQKPKFNLRLSELNNSRDFVPFSHYENESPIPARLE